jgi:hypothetical protein
MTGKHAKPRQPEAVDPGRVYVYGDNSDYFMPPGDVMRRETCLVCDRMIGAEPATTVKMVTFAPCPCEIGELITHAFIAHSGCPTDDVDMLVTKALIRIEGYGKHGW